MKNCNLMYIYSDGSEEDVTDKACYATSNPQVAAVNKKGKISAVSVGKAVVTVTYEDKTATCEVEVTGKI